MEGQPGARLLAKDRTGFQIEGYGYLRPFERTLGALRCLSAGIGENFILLARRD